MKENSPSLVESEQQCCFHSFQNVSLWKWTRLTVTYWFNWYNSTSPFNFWWSPDSTKALNVTHRTHRWPNPGPPRTNSLTHFRTRSHWERAKAKTRFHFDAYHSCMDDKWNCWDPSSQESLFCNMKDASSLSTQIASESETRDINVVFKMGDGKEVLVSYLWKDP